MNITEIGVRKFHNMLGRDCTVIDDGPDIHTEVVTVRNGRGQILKCKVNGWNRFIEKQQREEV